MDNQDSQHPLTREELREVMEKIFLPAFSAMLEKKLKAFSEAMLKSIEGKLDLMSSELKAHMQS